MDFSIFSTNVCEKDNSIQLLRKQHYLVIRGLLYSKTFTNMLFKTSIFVKIKMLLKHFP